MIEGEKKGVFSIFSHGFTVIVSLGYPMQCLGHDLNIEYTAKNKKQFDRSFVSFVCEYSPNDRRAPIIPFAC